MASGLRSIPQLVVIVVGAIPDLNLRPILSFAVREVEALRLVRPRDSSTTATTATSVLMR